MVVRSRSENLANALHSVREVADQIVIVHTGGGGGQEVAHLASEYDAQYLTSPDDPDESALLNAALERADSPWALFLKHEEVLRSEAPGALLDWLQDQEATTVEFPIVSLDEPRNYFFDSRLIRTDRAVRWEHQIYPTLRAGMNGAAGATGPEHAVEIMPHAAIISLGAAEPEEWELRDIVIRVEKELDRDPEGVRYWYYLAEAAKGLEEWDRADAAVEEGLNVVSRHLDFPRREPMAVSGLMGMLCASLLKGNHHPEKTVDSLWVIFNNMEGNGRFSVPLGRLLWAADRAEDAIAAQHQAAEHFFRDRRYHLGLDEGLYAPILVAWELGHERPGDELLDSIVKVQTLLGRHQYSIEPLLQYISQQNQPLFQAIRGALQAGLAN
ncbi:MAG: hypothetical protein V3U35_05055 [Candidatus Neomarinimicrobiota bacterium]